MNIRRTSIYYRLRYYWWEFCKIVFGRCRACGTVLNFTRNNVGICPSCGKRH